MKPKITMVAGLPGSGKTTMVKQLTSRNAVRFNLDELRTALGFVSRDSWSKAQESCAVEALLSGTERAVDNGLDVVMDNTFLFSNIPKTLRARVGGRATFKVVNLLDTVSVETCIEQDAGRDKAVGEAVIRKLDKARGKWKLTDEYMNVWPEIDPYEPVYYGAECIIVDLDGTMARHVSRGPYEVDRCHEDAPNGAVIQLVLAYSEFKSWSEILGTTNHVVFLSGRDGRVYGKTHEWLVDVAGMGNGKDWELHMRSEGDLRPDFVVKYDLFNAHVRDRFDVVAAFDDRDQCVRLWRELGIRTFQVDYGSF